MDIIIQKLSEAHLNDFLHFFDNVAFCDNPDWADCYCYFFYVPDDQIWLKRSKSQNRQDSVAAIEGQKLNGFLAYMGGTPVGWCNADTVSNYSRIVQNGKIEIEPDKKAAAVVCFVVDSNHRKKGIAKILLQACCRYYKQEGYHYIEAYPRKNPKNDAENYYGPLQLFLSEQFLIQKEFEDFYIIRKYFKENGA